MGSQTVELAFCRRDRTSGSAGHAWMVGRTSFSALLPRRDWPSPRLFVLILIMNFCGQELQGF